MVAAIWSANLAATAWGLRTGLGTRWHGFAVLVALVGLAASLAGGYWLAAGLCLATLILLFRDWWNRKGRRVAKLIGGKGRAVITGLAEKLREVLEPVPEGAGA